jgi:hypothetical protein
MTKFTHKGWFAFCPVILANPWSECPTVAPRWPALNFLLGLAVELQKLTIGVCSLMNSEYVPGLAIRITGKIE